MYRIAGNIQFAPKPSVNISRAQGSVAVLSLEVFEINHEFTDLQKYSWQWASAELAICTAHVDECWVVYTKSASACH